MDVFIASLVLIAAIAGGASQESRDQFASDPTKKTATGDASAAYQGDVSVCARQGVQILERDLTVQAGEEVTTDGL